MTDSASPDCEALLSQAGWVRALARHLTADAHRADDLAQDALTAALVRPPPGDRPLRAWLSATLRNLAREERRGEANRRARERTAARGEADGSSAQLLERLESHRAVVEAVARLDEPYRAAILLRYFEGLSPSAIAGRSGVQLRTVHTRLHRALAKLRAELDRAHGGDRRAWLLALIPIARGSQGWSTVGVGALVMDVKLKVALAVVALVGICSTIALWSDDSADDRPSAPAVAAGVIEGDAQKARRVERPLEVSPGGPERRAQGAAPPAPPAAPVPAPVSELRLTGRVIDTEGAAVASVLVRFLDADRNSGLAIEGRTDARGRFDLERPQSYGQIQGRLDVVAPGWTVLFRPEFKGMPEPAVKSELVLVIARSVTVRGVVVDEQLRPIESAAVGVSLPFGLRSRFDAILDSSSVVEHETTSGADGRFELAEVPEIEGASLETEHAEYLRDVRPLAALGELEHEIVLRSVKAEPARLVGTVVDPDGEPAEGAWVSLGGASVKSGPSGAFSFDLTETVGPANEGIASATTLRAVKLGYLPGATAREPEGAWPSPLVLRLGEPPLSIEGRVVDAEGEPVAHAEIWTDSEDHFGYVDIEEGEMSMQAGASVEGILRGDPWTRRFRADASGRFEMRGLLPRDYRIHALDKRRLLATTASIPAGTRNAQIRMPKEDLHDLVAGRVTSLSGEPVEGLRVTLERAIAGVQGHEVEKNESFSAKTDAEGRFAFEKVSRSVNSVSVQGGELALMGFQRALRPEDDFEKLEIAVPMRVHVQIEAGEQRDFDKVEILGVDGEKEYLAVQHGKSAYTMHEVHIEEGRTEVFSVSELGKTLVLYKGDVEVRRVPVKLVRGGLNTIRP